MNGRKPGPQARRGVGLACAALMVLAGCAKQETPQVASVAPAVEKPASAAPADAGVKAELVEYVKGRKAWVDCMGKNGLDLPDPDARGEVDKDLDKGDPKVRKAATACTDLYKQPSPELDEYLTPVATPEQKAASKAYAECMRSNGVADFPDPNPSGKNIQPPIMGEAGVDAKYLKAQATCFKLPQVAKAYPGWSPDSSDIKG